MSTPDAPVIDPRFRVGDKYREAVTDMPLTRDSEGRWLTDWGMWVLSDQHLTELVVHRDTYGYWTT